MAEAASRARSVPSMGEHYQEDRALAPRDCSRRGRAPHLAAGIYRREQMDTEVAGRTDDDWRKALTPEQYRVLRKHGTERAGTSALNAEKRAGTFVCAGCGQPLYRSDTKF